MQADGRYVLLCYRREAPTELSAGAFLLVDEDAAAQVTTNEVLSTFEHSSFKDMLGKFSGYLRDHPECQAAMQRTDRPGLVPVFFAQESTRLLREDPVSAFRAMNVSELRVDLRDSKPAPAPVVPEITPIFTAGHDALADVFGYQLYCRAQFLGPGKVEIECPGCGFWSTHSFSSVEERVSSFQCKKGCLLEFPLESLHERWATFCVLELLSLPVRRFYFPRGWATNSWMTKQELEEKFKQFKAELEQVNKEIGT